MTRDWKNEPMTRAEQDAWDEHEAYLIAQGQHDRAAYLDAKQRQHDLNRAICEALANPEPWED